MNSTEVQNPRHKLDDKCLCLSHVSCVRFCSCLCKVCLRVSEALLLALRTLSLITRSDSNAFLRFIGFSSFPVLEKTAFTFYCISRAVAADTSCWTPKSARRQNRENGHTHTQGNCCNLASFPGPARSSLAVRNSCRV